MVLGRGPEANYGTLFGSLIFYLSILPNHQGADSRTERLRQKSVSAPIVLVPGPNANYGTFFGSLIFYFSILPNHQRADNRTERLRQNSVSAPMVSGRRSNANYGRLFGSLMFYLSISCSSACLGFWLIRLLAVAALLLRSWPDLGAIRWPSGCIFG